MSGLCYCYRLFVYLSLLAIILKPDHITMIALDKDIINIAFLDYFS